ncbi:MAG: hypothetical protein K6T91_05945 [Firmicutes bacterium]|nr:hypothetical protein [Bacillota bacterium]
MIRQTIGKKAIQGLVLLITPVFLLFLTTASLVIAQDTGKIVYDRCTECHVAGKDSKTGKTYWEGRKLTDKQWASIVDNMVRYGARLSESESRLVVEYLTAMSKGSFKRQGTNIRQIRRISFDNLIKVAKGKTVAKAEADLDSDLKVVQGANSTLPPVAGTPSTNNAPTLNAPLGSSASGTVPAVPHEQAKTGVEMIWYLLGGGSLIGAGMAIRNRGKLKKVGK